jgi:DNA-binding LacI/PurR family transcriptional regulator
MGINAGITLDDIASMSGVSKATVSRVINKSAYVSEATKQKVEAVLDELSYQRPNANVKWQVAYDEITVIVENQLNATGGNTFYGNLFSAMESQAHELGLKVRLVRVPRSLHIFSEKLKEASAVVLLGVDDTDILNVIKEHQLPAVIINGIDPKCGISSVSPDYYLGAYQSTKLLIDKGHSRIKMLTSNINHTTRLRQEGFRKAMNEHGLTTQDCIIDFQKLDPINSRQEIDFAANRLLPSLIESGELDGYTAIVCMCDMIAISLTDTLEELGINTAEKFAVVGFDNIEAGRFNTPSLTTITSEVSDLCTIALNTLVQVSNSPSTAGARISSRVTLIERESTSLIVSNN